jgi:DNA-binding transcriptional LysR family regulator
MSAQDRTTLVRILFDASLPHARWGPLFHVFCLERPDARLQWQPTGFRTRAHSLLDGGDVGLLLVPPRATGLDALTIDASPMVVMVAAGDRLAHQDELRVADIVDRSFPGSPNLDREWTSFWTLDEHRGRPPKTTDDDVRSIDDALQVVAAGRAIATLPAWVADGLPHPGVLALPLRDGPEVRTRLVWRADDDKPAVHALVDLATAWTRDGRD